MTGFFWQEAETRLNILLNLEIHRKERYQLPVDPDKFSADVMNYLLNKRYLAY